MTRAYKPWRPSELERARQVLEDGGTWRSVADVLGRSEASVYTMVGTLKESAFGAEDWLREQLREKRVPVVPKYTYKYWRPSELTRAREMRAAGHTWRQVAEALNRSEGAVTAYVTTMNREDAMLEVTGRRNARYAQLSDHERRIVDAKLNEGLSVKAAAEHVGRHWFVVSTYKRTRGPCAG